VGVCCALTALAACVNSYAQPVTLEALFATANRHPDAAISETGVDAAMGSLTAADRAPLPIVSTSVSSIDLQNGVGPGSIAGGKRIDKSIGVDWTWERGDKRVHRVRSAALSLDASRLEQIEVLIRRKIAIADAFWDLLAAQERESDSEQMLRSAEQMAELARIRLEKGDTSEQEFARVTIETARTRGDDEGLRAARRLAAVTLAQAAALPGGHPVAVSGWPISKALTEPESSAVTISHLDHRADIRAARARVSAARSALDLARSLQVVDGTWGGGFNHAPPDHRASVQIRAQIPWQLNYQFEGEIRQAVAALTRAEAELRLTILNADAEINALNLRRISSALRATAIEREILPRSTEVLNRAEAAYAKGATPLTDLLDARRTFRAVRLDAVQARADAARAETEWLLRTQVTTP